MAVVSMKQLLEAGVHFGHTTKMGSKNEALYFHSKKWNLYYRFKNHC